MEQRDESIAMIFIRTIGRSSMDRYSQSLSAQLSASVVETDIYQRTSEVFNRSWASPSALRASVTAMTFTARVRSLDEPIHFPNHHLARYATCASQPYIVTVHDLIRFFDIRTRGQFIHPPNSRDRALLALDYRAIRRAPALVSISQTTKNDIVRHLGVDPDRVTVAYPGVDQATFQPCERRLLDRPYILFVGSEQPRKNMQALMHTMALLREWPETRDLVLVKVGSAGGAESPFREATLRLVDLYGVHDRVMFAGTVSDDALRAYYSGALCTVLPSTYEGFGMPVVEAMACGCPTVVSDRGALPEIAGDAAVVIPPTGHDLAAAVRQLATSERTRRRLRSAGLQRVSSFTWKACGEVINRLHERVDAASRHASSPASTARRP